MFRAAVAMTLFIASAAHSADAQWPVVIPAPNGAVILSSAAEKEGYDDYRYAAPYPAWTAIGTNGLLPPRGLVEVQMVARLPTPSPNTPASKNQ